MGTATVRKLIRTRPARTSEDIAERIATIARRIQRKASKGEGLDVDEARFLAKKLAIYAARLRAPASIRSTPADPVFPTIQG